jgi:hypothetical protein
LGPFILQEVEVYGLKHAVSKKQEKEKTSVIQPDELFYDITTWDTFITCSNYHRKVPPFDLLSHCEHLFIVSELKAVASIGYEKDDLPRWREIEREIRKIAHSFIVE